MPISMGSPRHLICEFSSLWTVIPFLTKMNAVSSSGFFLTFMREVGISSNQSARSAVGESIERKFGNMPSCMATTIVNVNRFGGSNKDGLHGCGMVMFTDK